uniref:Uncharacterized protein n=1 Tax=Knipowitschia caucasica TaxID=637954 RepID=A0AAV2JG62_KNICA
MEFRRVTSLLLQIRRCRPMRWQCKVWIQSNNKRTQCTLQLRGPERLSFGVLWNTLENKGTISSKNSTTLRTDTVTSTPGASANDRPKNVGIVIEGVEVITGLGDIARACSPPDTSLDHMEQTFAALQKVLLSMAEAALACGWASGEAGLTAAALGKRAGKWKRKWS